MKVQRPVAALTKSLALAACLAVAACDAAPATSPRQPAAASQPTARSGYAPIGPLRMYYEVHGTGSPVLLIHGAISTIDTSFGTTLPALAKRHQVIAIEGQGHGHTADVERPLTFEQMADDAAALLRHLKVSQADVVGYSDGGNVAVALALRHPELVRRLVVAGTNYSNDGLDPAVRKWIETGATQPATEVVKGIPPQFANAYAEVAPQPGNWPTLVSKIMKQGAAFRGWTPAQIGSIAAPTLIVLGDRDIVTPEHALEMFRQHQDARLAILPGRDHLSLVGEGGALAPLLLEFLAAPAKPAATTHRAASKGD